MLRLAAITALGAGLLLWAPTARADEYPADNTGKNVRDRDPAALTSGDQSNASADVAITQDIRKAVMADDVLSTNAQNVKIITTPGGVVTLRGPVASDEERARIEAKALAAPGVTKVNNLLEIASD